MLTYRLIKLFMNFYWEVHCPHCHAITEDYQHLSKASSQSHCQGCKKDFQADFTRWIDVTFSLNKEIDERKFIPVCTPPNHLQFIFAISNVVQSQTKTVMGTIEKIGTYKYVCSSSQSTGLLLISGEKT